MLVPSRLATGLGSGWQFYSHGPASGLAPSQLCATAIEGPRGRDASVCSVPMGPFAMSRLSPEFRLRDRPCLPCQRRRSRGPIPGIHWEAEPEFKTQLVAACKIQPLFRSFFRGGDGEFCDHPVSKLFEDVLAFRAFTSCVDRPIISQHIEAELSASISQRLRRGRVPGFESHREPW